MERGVKLFLSEQSGWNGKERGKTQAMFILSTAEPRLCDGYQILNVE